MKCDKCGNEIYRYYWDINGNILCNACAKEDHQKKVEQTVKEN